jgi:hypothetical protein
MACACKGRAIVRKIVMAIGMPGKGSLPLPPHYRFTSA